MSSFPLVQFYAKSIIFINYPAVMAALNYKKKRKEDQLQMMALPLGRGTILPSECKSKNIFCIAELHTASVISFRQIHQLLNASDLFQRG